jgi:alkylhydroperoxidase family enzyme
MTMAFIRYIPPDDIPLEDRVPDQDNILRVHGVHPRAMPLHYDLYRELMHGPGPLTRVQREMIAVVVSATNGCHY